MQLSHNKLKSEMKIIFFVINMNSNWEVVGGGGRVIKNQYTGGDCPKKGSLDSLLI